MNNQVIQPTSHKVVASISYLSILFLPVILPLIVWIVASNYPFIKKHAKRAFWTQLAPILIGLIFMLLVGIFGSFSGNIWSFHYAFSGGWLFFTGVVLFAIMCLAMFIYNVAMAVKILIN